MIDIQAGDVVVCVDDAECDCGCGPTPLRLRATYRVIGVEIDDDDQVGLRLAYPPAPGRHTSFSSSYFRKVYPATDQFTTQIKAIRPIREDA